MPSDKQSIVQKSTSILLENKNRVRIKKEVKNWHFLSSFPRNAFSINQANIIILQSINISIVWLWITIYFSELHFSSIKSFIKVFILNIWEISPFRMRTRCKFAVISKGVLIECHLSIPITGNIRTCTEYPSVWQNDWTWQMNSGHWIKKKCVNANYHDQI